MIHLEGGGGVGTFWDARGSAVVGAGDDDPNVSESPCTAGEPHADGASNAATVSSLRAARRRVRVPVEPLASSTIRSTPTPCRWSTLSHRCPPRRQEARRDARDYSVC